VAVQRTTFSFAALAQGLFGAQRILLIWIAARQVLEGRLSVGLMLVLVAYAEQFAARTRGLVDKLIDLRLLRVHAERIADIALEEPESDVASSYVGPEPAPSLQLDNLAYRYAEDDRWVLRGCSLSIQAGESVAIVGPSGCGKTTLAKVILGLLAPQEGCVRLGGVEARHYGLGAYRAQFGVVMQEDDLFSGSIADNIAFFDPEATLERVRAAAALADIAADVEAMPMGYETPVGDMGSTLSGGQKQRVLLARALYRNPRILLLDEATSHLDVERERHINRAVARLSMTRIIIAHRPETIASADRVIHLVDGTAQSLSSLEYRRQRAEREALPA
jgi:ATP-binding cassette subfamily B protein RaxB